MSARTEHTEVLTDQKEVMKAALNMFSQTKGGVDILAEELTTPEGNQAQSSEAAQAYFDVKKRGGRLRIVTRIDEKNIAYSKELMKIVELRHLEDAKGNFALTDSEYMSSPTTTYFQPSTMMVVIYSNARLLIDQNKRVFETLWSRAEPAVDRIKEIEEGVEPPKVEIMRNHAQIQALYLKMIGQAKNEILLILPTANAFQRDEKIGVVKALQEVATRGRVKVGMVTPNSSIQERIKSLNKSIEATPGSKTIEHRRILEASTPNTVTVLVIDRDASLVIEQNDDSKEDFDSAVGIATYSTRNSTVLANVRFFERVWEEVDLRETEELVLEKERRSRKAAELLQDILAHDIRNYNQISLTSAELLRAGLQSAESLGFVDTIVNAIKGSSELVERAKKLGRIISQAEIQLHPVNLGDSVQRSVALVLKAHPDRPIKLSSSTESAAFVLADELLEEAFTNIISNSVTYTETHEVPVEIKVQEAEGPSGEGKRIPFWKVTFTDHGKGIPDKIKEKMFTRYLSVATGAGLGLSIVHALVVDRYAGKVAITDRVPGDHTKGTRVEVWLPRSS